MLRTCGDSAHGQGQGVTDLCAAARGVVHEDAAAPCAVVGAAVLHTPEAPLDEGEATSCWRYGWGTAGVLWRDPPVRADDPPAATTETFFDLASVTKPMTSLLLARLQRAGVMSRQERLGDVLTELAETAAGEVTLDVLLAHRSGLEAHREFFVKRSGAVQPELPAILLEAANARRAPCVGPLPSEGFPVVYSDLGYILTGAAIERRTGRPLDELVAEEVAAPLELRVGSARHLRERVADFDERVAPTEDVAWRGGVLRGIVHDENAWVIGGSGSAGHAGLFGDVRSLVGLGTAVLEAWRGLDSSWLSRDELEPLVRVRPNGSHRSGFDGKSGDTPSCGRLFGPATFGHLGFTGTSLWMDPDAMIVGVLLTNRVHPTREHIAIRRARPRAYERLHDAMCGSS